MNRNVEIKAKATDMAALARRARELATSPGEVLHQEDIFFNSPRGRLKLRTINNTSSELIYYERSDETAPKNSSYILLPVDDPVRMRQFLERANGVRGIVRKHRTLFLVGPTRIHLDEVEGLGNFIELEVVLQPAQSIEEGVRIAKELMGKLCVDESCLLPGAYIDLQERVH
jgi:predicted adenylyl cyclase CyaB